MGPDRVLHRYRKGAGKGGHGIERSQVDVEIFEFPCPVCRQPRRESALHATANGKTDVGLRRTERRAAEHECDGNAAKRWWDCYCGTDNGIARQLDLTISQAAACIEQHLIGDQITEATTNSAKPCNPGVILRPCGAAERTSSDATRG